MDVVAVLGQPSGMDAGAPTDVQHNAWRRRQMAAEQLLGSYELQPAMPGPNQPLVLVVPFAIEVKDCGIELAHPRIVPRRCPRGRSPRTRRRYGCAGIRGDGRPGS